MRVLVACEFSGIVRDAFIARGHNALSCDLLPTERPGPHYQGDVLDILDDGWDLMIAHPPCTYVCSSSMAHINKPGRWEKALEAVEFVKLLLNAPVEHIALENPVGILSTYVRKPDQIIQPYWFGDEAQKGTCLWLKALPPLKPTRVVGRGTLWVQKNGRKRGAAWTMKLPPSPDRWKIRSRTFQGIADAMAQQWGNACDYEVIQQLALF